MSSRVYSVCSMATPEVAERLAVIAKARNVSQAAALRILVREALSRDGGNQTHRESSAYAGKTMIGASVSKEERQYFERLANSWNISVAAALRYLIVEESSLHSN